MAETRFARKRMNPRYSLDAEAEIMGPSDRAPIPAQVTELSLRGCYMDTVKTFPVGADLRLRVNCGSSVCELPGKVIYSHPGYGTGLFGMGVLFGEMGEEQRSTISTWLEQLAGKKPESVA